METMAHVTETSFDWSVDVYAMVTGAPAVSGRELERYGATDRQVRVVGIRLHLSSSEGVDQAERRAYLKARLVKKDGTLGTAEYSYTVWNYELPDRPEWLRTLVEDLTLKARALAARKLAG